VTLMRDDAAVPARTVVIPHKLAAQVARRIESDILESGWKVGTVFGSEADLRERYGVSRAVLREAIRLVEHHEVATMRRGPSGGLVVRAPESGPLTAATVIYLEHVGTTVEDLLAARMLLEPLAARLAADRMGEGGVHALRETIEQERRSPDFVGGRDLLHTALGQLSGNAALRLFIAVLVDLTGRYAHRPERAGPGEAVRVKHASDQAHGAIVDVIIAGERGRAEQRTIRHLEAMQEWLLSAEQRPIGGTAEAGATTGESGLGKQKLAETVARRMMADIAGRGAKVGEVIGSEAELLARFGVSRAVFREAVRLLEYHSVARMRRGPGGGLVVAQPDSTASIEAMAIYLDYEKIGVEDLRAVRDVLEMGCLELVVERHDDPIVEQRLQAAIRAERLPRSAGIDERAHHVHTEIAELAGNPVLALFLRIITTVWARHIAPLDDEQESRATAQMASQAHRRIVDAVLAGDLPLARHRMRRHLEALDSWWH
jgi:DNA-binding FadR family transcriptional regulator